jgi:FdhE protein
MDETRREWLLAYPFLAPLAHFDALVRGAAEGLGASAPSLPPLEAYADEHREGVPLLASRVHGAVLREAGASRLGALAERVVALPLPKKLVAGCAELNASVSTSAGREAAVGWLLADAPEADPPQAGLLRFLGWTALRTVLASPAEAYRAFRDAHRWLRPICPTCGQKPGLARLTDRASGRERWLACGCCGTQWSWRRIGCPFCGNEAAERLAVLELEGSAGLRLDVCEACHGYLKTFAGQGDGAFFLADWPTLVLDAMASERGYLRRGTSLYEL